MFVKMSCRYHRDTQRISPVDDFAKSHFSDYREQERNNERRDADDITREQNLPSDRRDELLASAHSGARTKPTGWSDRFSSPQSLEGQQERSEAYCWFLDALISAMREVRTESIPPRKDMKTPRPSAPLDIGLLMKSNPILLLNTVIILPENAYFSWFPFQKARKPPWSPENHTNSIPQIYSQKPISTPCEIPKNPNTIHFIQQFLSTSSSVLLPSIHFLFISCVQYNRISQHHRSHANSERLTITRNHAPNCERQTSISSKT